MTHNTQMNPIIGVDGCRQGWFACRQQSGKLTGDIFPHFSDLMEKYPQAKIIIDIPIGLPEEKSRELDSLMRQHLPGRESCVFTVPPRKALYASSYPEACDISHKFVGRKISRQSWAIAKKICEVDQYLIQNPTNIERVFESHPELCFARFAGAPLMFGKKKLEGIERRKTLLGKKFADADDFYMECKARFRAALAPDDILDAMALLATGIGDTETLIDPGRQDENGIPIRALIPAN